MKASLLTGFGGRENLVYGDAPDPPVGAGEVRVRVRAVALNHLDVWVRKGLPGLRIALPHVLGADVAGVVDEIGAGVAGVAPGQEVVLAPATSCGRCVHCLDGDDNLCRDYAILGEHRPGGCAELCTVPAVNVLPAPRGLAPAEAAAVPLVFLTAWQMLVRRARVAPGDFVLVWGAGSGVGSAAVQIAKMQGATVVATVGADAKRERARALGADHVLCHAADDVVAEVRRLTGKRGVDVVFEHTGAATWARSIQCARKGGTIVTCGATTGFEATTDLRHVFFRQLNLLGSTMGRRGDVARVIEHVAAGRLRPVVDSVLPLRDAAEGHRRIEDRETFGKVVLSVE